MAVSRLRHPTCFFTCSALLLILVSINDVEASSCQRVIHKKVGDTVELPSCLPTDGVTDAAWKYGQIKLADKDKLFHEKQFKDRLELNHHNFSLTVKQLTLQDSGNFRFLSEENDTQRETVIITLQVHEPITKQPTLTYNSTWHTSNESCTVFLECNAASDSSVDYKWTVRNQTRSGSGLQYILSAQDGDTDFTCTIYNLVTEKSAYKTVTCKQGSSSSVVPLLIGLVIGMLLIIVLLLSLLCYTKSKGCCFNRLTQSPTQVNPAKTQEQVYSSLLHGDGCVYETISGPEDAGAGERPNSYINVTPAGVHG
ncbi:signaling lymphocytic activation molecule-like isoform X2 [Sparus aurata]|nr:SLAM family member 8 isoform X2 [Sparus aurata]